AQEQGDLEAALEQLDVATKMDMTNAPMLLALGQIARDAGQLDRAEKSYRTLLMIVRRRGPDEAVEVGLGEVLYELHAIASAHGDREKADELISSALEATAQSQAEALRFAEALTSRGVPELAVSGLERRLAVAEDAGEQARLLSALAGILDTSLGKHGEALERRLSALRKIPSDLELHAAARSLALRLEATRRYVELVREVAEGHRRREDAPKVARLFLLAGTALEEDVADLAVASEYYRRAEDLAEDALRTTARVALARTAAAQGDQAEQLRIFELLVREPSVSDLERTEMYYRLAEAQLANGATTESGLATLKVAFEREPRHAQAATALAAVAKRGEASDALFAFYEKVARGSLDDGITLELLEEKSKRPGATAATFREATERALAARAPSRAEVFLVRLIELADAGQASDDEQRWALLSLTDLREAAGDV
ncbi:MAG: hypothetical protein H5U40_00115, partial [Polyangiaceae bacterium]|nr:hypothetical protein [Polyangiaceae bacterium]